MWYSGIVGVAPKVRGEQMKKEEWEKVGEVNGPDSKNRIILTPALKRQDVDGFTVFTNPIGEIKLVPVIKVPAYEAWLYTNPKALEDVRTGMKQALEDKAAPLEKFRKQHKK